MSGIAAAVVFLATSVHGGPYVETQPYVGADPPDACVFEVDGTRTKIPIETIDAGQICRLNVGDLNAGVHVARARYVRNDNRGPWSQLFSFWAGRLQGGSVWTWEKAIICDGVDCTEER